MILRIESTSMLIKGSNRHFWLSKKNNSLHKDYFAVTCVSHSIYAGLGHNGLTFLPAGHGIELATYQATIAASSAGIVRQEF